MPGPRKPSDPATDNLLLIVGQLLEATKVASEGLKSLGQEVQVSSKAIIATSKTLELVERTVNELSEIVSNSTNPGNLVSVSQSHTSAITLLQVAVDELKAARESLRRDVATLGTHNIKEHSRMEVVWRFVQFFGWITVIGVTLYGAIGQWR